MASTRERLGNREKSLLLVQGILMLSAFILEVIGCIFFYDSNDAVFNEEMFRRCILVPLISNSAITLLEVILMAVFRHIVFLRKIIALIALVGICTVISVAHYDFLNMGMVFAIPILMSILFGDMMISAVTVMSSFSGMAVSVVVRLDSSRFNATGSIETSVSFVFLVIYSVFSVMTLTIIRRQEDKLRKEKEKADLANQSKTDFLSNMSHEIRTPINAILGMNEMILKETSETSTREYASNIYSSGNALLGLVNDILDMTKIESGSVQLVEDTYHLHEMLHDCCSFVSERIQKKNLQFDAHVQEDLPSVLIGDESRLRQITVNFLTNAAKYTHQGSILLDVSGTLSGDELMLRVSVKDSGIGIREEDLPKVFGRFERFDIKKNRSIEGTGLGLKICKELADLMGGKISVSSVYGEGSEFSFCVPQKVYNSVPVGKFCLSDRFVHKVAVFHQSFRAPDAHILAVDDVDMNLIVFENLLKETGMHIDLAASGKKAVELASQTKYDMIFMDHMMPEMDGIEAYRKIQETSSVNLDTPVVMLTANALSEARRDYLKEGFCDYVSKPVNGRSLEEVLLKYLPKDKITRIATEEKNG